MEEILDGFTLSRTQTENIWKIRMGQVDVLMLAEGFATRPATDKGFFVGLSGAISNVAQKQPPYFAGQQIAARLGVPLLSFSDPTLERDPALGLAFYAGNDTLPDLPEWIAQVINRFTCGYDRAAVLFGGSGGGFAALNILPHCGAQDSAVVWNPQTNPSRYYWSMFRVYARAAFPSIFAACDTRSVTAAPVLGAAIAQSGCTMDLKAETSRGRVFYFQNFSDQFHMTEHLLPFCAGNEVQRLCRNGFVMPERDTYVSIGNWAEGHAPLPRDLLLRILEGALRREEPRTLQSGALAMLEVEQLAPGVALAGQVSQSDVAIDCVWQGADLEITASLGGQPQAGLTYALYLMSGRTRLAIQWYQDTPVWQLTPPEGADLSVRLFLRDAFGGKQIFSVPVPPR